MRKTEPLTSHPAIGEYPMVCRHNKEKGMKYRSQRTALHYFQRKYYLEVFENGPKMPLSGTWDTYAETLDTQQSCSRDQINHQSCDECAGIRAVGTQRMMKAIFNTSLLFPSPTPQHRAWTAPAQNYICHMSTFIATSVYSSSKHTFLLPWLF